MKSTRLEAFSDGVIAIIITIMVLEFKTPYGDDFQSLLLLAPVFFSYVLSFIYVGIYWNNHHHLMHAAKNVTGSILWANLHLLFWLSLIPFTTGWMGESHFGILPTALYGFILLMCAIAYWILQTYILATQEPNSALKKSIGIDWKGKLSPPLYFIAMISTAWHEWISIAIYVAVALMWLVPDKRIERALKD